MIKQHFVFESDAFCHTLYTSHVGFDSMCSLHPYLQMSASRCCESPTDSIHHMPSGNLLPHFPIEFKLEHKIWFYGTIYHCCKMMITFAELTHCTLRIHTGPIHQGPNQSPTTLQSIVLTSPAGGEGYCLLVLHCIWKKQIKYRKEPKNKADTDRQSECPLGETHPTEVGDPFQRRGTLGKSFTLGDPRQGPGTRPKSHLLYPAQTSRGLGEQTMHRLLEGGTTGRFMYRHTVRESCMNHVVLQNCLYAVHQCSVHDLRTCHVILCRIRNIKVINRCYMHEKSVSHMWTQQT